jgi:hypothetical protein
MYIGIVKVSVQFICGTAIWFHEVAVKNRYKNLKEHKNLESLFLIKYVN